MQHYIYLFFFSFQEPAAVLGVAGVDALPVLHQPAKHRRAENHRDGVCHLPHPSLSRHQIRVGRLARLGGHPVHHPLQGQSAHYNHAWHTHKRRLDTALFIFISWSSSIPSSVSFLVFHIFCFSTFYLAPSLSLCSKHTHLRAHTTCSSIFSLIVLNICHMTANPPGLIPTNTDGSIQSNPSSLSPTCLVWIWHNAAHQVRN